MKLLNLRWLYTARLLLGALIAMAGIAAIAAAQETVLHKSSIDEAETAWYQWNLGLSRQNFENVWTDTGSVIEDRIKAAQQLAIQDWKFFRNYQSALTRLKQAEALGVKRSVTWQILSRIARERADYTEARATAKKAMDAAERASEKLDSRMLLAQAIHDQAVEDRLHGKQVDKSLLDEAYGALTAILVKEPGQPAASRLLLGVSVLREDGPTALRSWRNFFFIPGQQTATGLLAQSGKSLDLLLPKWHGRLLSTSELQELIIALAQSRFFEYALVVANDLKDLSGKEVESLAAIKGIVLYAKFVRFLKQTTDEYYRQIAINTSKKSIPSLAKEYQDKLWGEAARLWEQLPFSGERPKFKQQLFLAEINRRFGAEFLGPGPSSSCGYALFMGHRIGDDTIEVQQYGHKAKLRYIVLDSMVSNDYSGWFWDGRALPGGWANGHTIVWIREGNLGQPFGLWRMVADPANRSETEKLIAQNTALDDTLIRKNPYTYLPGLSLRLQFDAANRIYEAQKAKGYKDNDLCVAFVNEFLRLKLEFGIIAHEGRHAIDMLDHPIVVGTGAPAELR